MLSNAIQSFWKDEEAATAVEYGLMVALIAAVIVGTVQILGENVEKAFDFVATKIGAATPAP